MNDYELMTILNPEIRDEEVTETVERLTNFITSRGGEVENVDQWGRRRLAYPIARQFEGTYVVTHLRLQPANAAELEANLRISEDVLRHLLVRYSPAEQAAALAASQRRRPRPPTDEQPEGGVPTAPGATEPSGAEAPTVSGSPEAVEPEAEAAVASSGAAEPETPLVSPASPVSIDVSEPEAEAEEAAGSEETDEPKPSEGA